MSRASNVTRKGQKAFDERTSGFEGQAPFLNSAAQERRQGGAGPGAAAELGLGNLRPRLGNRPPAPAWASSPGPIRKQPSGSGNSRGDPEGVSAVTRECWNPPFAWRRWRQLRRRSRARMAGDGGRGLVREGASVHARGGGTRGVAELGAGGVGVVRGDWRKGRGHAARREGAGPATPRRRGRGLAASGR